MENLIDFDDPHPQLRNPMSPAWGKLFGVIKRAFFAVEVSGVDENNVEILQPGTLIEIKPGYRGDECLFKIRNFTNSLEKYRTTIYKCKKTDYITITEELWPYLLALKNNEGLLKLVENINKKEFSLDMLKLGSEVQIRGPPDNEAKYYEFVVTYNGLMKEISGIGYYVGLQLKNNRVPLTSNLKRLSQHYRFEGIGIVVQIDWIMLNLYTEEEGQPKSQLIQYKEPSSNVSSIDKKYSEAKNTNFTDFRTQTHSPIEPLKRFSDTAVSEITNSSPSDLVENENHNMRQTLRNDFVENKLNNNLNDQRRPQTNEQIQKMVDEVLGMPEFQMGTTCNFVAKTGSYNNDNEAVKISGTAVMSHDMCQTLPIDLIENEWSKKNNDENHIVQTSPINEQPKHTIKIATISKRCDEKFEFPWEADGASKISAIRAVPNNNPTLPNDFADYELNKNPLYCISNNASRDVQTPSINQYPKISNSAKWCIFCNSLHEPGEHTVPLTKVQSKIPYDTDSLSNQFDQSLENSCDTTLNYPAEMESVTNDDGAVRNAEKTICDFCHITVEIGEGIILRECLHSFCTKCIRVHVYRNSKYSKIRCPYKQDYLCEFDLQDVEIKDLGGEKLYNTIVENRLKEYMDTEPNARWCTNKACDNMWVSQRDPYQQNERCPKCNVNFCLICQIPHEPDERHENKSMKTAILGKVEKMVKADRPEPSVNCVICRQTNIPVNKYVKLQNCQHTICTVCVMPMIKSQISRSPHAYCSFCKVYLSYYEAAKITEFAASSLCRNIIPTIQPEVAAPLEICICRPSLGNCGITLQCKHTFCRKYIASIVREQFNNKGFTVCPRCNHEIDKNIIRHLVPALFREEIVEKCRICLDVVQFRLTNCQHGFCLKCIRTLIVNQVFDLNNMTVICTVCNMCVRNEDISRYGGQEIYAGYISKFENEAIKRSKQHNKLICSNSHETGERHKGSEEAESNATVKRGVELSSTITDKSNIKPETSAIPKTRRLLHETSSEINLFNPANRMLVKCNLCSKRIVIGSKIYISQCLHEFCKQCITKYIERNSKNSLIRCPYNKEYVCKINLLDNEIKKFGGELLYKKILDNRLKESRGADPNARVCSNEACRNIWMSPQNNLVNYERCSKCKTCWCCICSSVHEPGESHRKNFDNTRNVIEVPRTELGACAKCCKSKIPVSESNTLFCNKQGDRIQLDALQFPTTNKATVEPRPSRESISEKDTCSVCYEKCRHKIVLKNCGHEFCRQCVQANVSVQESNGTTPRCPMCRKSIERDEITRVKTLPPVVNAEVSRMNRETSLRFNNRPFDCPICYQNIDEECGVVLANCRDSLCRDCVLSVLLQQSTANLAPNCPLCQTEITDEEIRELDSAIYDIFVKNRLHRVNLEGPHDFEMQRRHPDIVETFFCSICETFELRASKVLTFCDHKFCRPCITASLNDQNMNNKVPTCPMCNFEVSDLDIFELCG